MPFPHNSKVLGRAIDPRRIRQLLLSELDHKANWGCQVEATYTKGTDPGIREIITNKIWREKKTKVHQVNDGSQPVDVAKKMQTFSPG